jgi:hypothetical protein
VRVCERVRMSVSGVVFVIKREEGRDGHEPSAVNHLQP